MRRIPVVCGLLLALWAMHGLPMAGPTSMTMAGPAHAVASAGATPTQAYLISSLGPTPARSAATIHRAQLGPTPMGACDAAHDHCAVTLRGTPDVSAAAFVPAVDDAGYPGAGSNPSALACSASPRAPPDTELRERLCISRT